MWALRDFLPAFIASFPLLFTPKYVCTTFSFNFRRPASPGVFFLRVITSLIVVMLVNGSPVCPLPSSPVLLPLKLPVGYYRDMFINAVYDSLSTLSLAALTSLFSTPILHSLNEMCLFFSPLPFVCLPHCSLLHMSLPFGSSAPFSPFSLSKSHYFVNFVASRCQRDLICESHSTELIPNLPPILKWASLKQLPQSRCLQYLRASVIVWLGAPFLLW